MFSNHKINLRFQAAIVMLALGVSLLSSCAKDSLEFVVDQLPVAEVEPILPPTTQWQNEIKSINSPLQSSTDLLKLENGQLAVATQEDALTISIIDPASGTTITKNTTSLDGTRNPNAIVMGNDLILETANGPARINALTGETVWESNRRGLTSFTEAGIIIVEFNNACPTNLYLIDPASGAEKLVKSWSTTAAEKLRIYSAYAVEGAAGQTLIALSLRRSLEQNTFNDEILFEVRSTTDYTLRWSHLHTLDLNPYRDAPILNNGQLVTAIGNTVYSFAIDNGAITWQYELPSVASTSASQTTQSPNSFRLLGADLDQNILFATEYAQTVAIDMVAGQVLWAKELDYIQRGISILNEDFATYTTQEGYGVLFAPQSGVELGRINPLHQEHPNMHSSAYLTANDKATIFYDGISVYAVELTEFVAAP